MTEAEKYLWRKLRNKQVLGFRFLRQYSVGSYVLDFYCPKVRLAIELDGGQHNEAEAQAYDRRREMFLKSKNISVIRFWNNDVLKNINGVLEVIARKLKESNPS